MDTVLSVVHAQFVSTVVVNKPQAITRYLYRGHRFIPCSRAGCVYSHLNKASDGYTALTRFIVVTVLSDVHVQVVFTVIVSKVSDGPHALRLSWTPF